MNYTLLIWVFILISLFIPIWKQRNLEATRLKKIRQFEKQRGSRLITIIHRQEAIAFLNIPLTRYINIEDSEQVLRAIRLTPPDMPIDILLHTPGGLVLATEQIAHAIRKHPAKVTVFVPHYAMSGGTLLALAADEIVMDINAVLGPIDPQLGKYPAVSILQAVFRKEINDVDDETLILADMAQKAIKQVHDLVLEILKDKMAPDEAEKLARQLTEGRWTHDYPITCEKLETLGIRVCGELPPEIYTLMDYYPQSPQRRPTVQFIPLPYGREKK